MSFQKIQSPAGARLCSAPAGTKNINVAEVNNGTVRFKAPGTAAIVATTPDGIFRDSCLIRVLEDFDLDGRPTFAGSLFGEWVQCDENLQVLPNPERFEFWKTVNTSSEGYQTVLYEGNYSYSGAFYQGTVTFNVVEKDFVMVTAIISAVAASHQRGWNILNTKARKHKDTKKLFLSPFFLFFGTFRIE